MIIFIVYSIILSYVILKFLNKFEIDSKFILISFVLKVVFIGISTYSNFSENKIFKVPDEDNYFHDVLVFHDLSVNYPLYYLKFLLDIEPENKVIFNKYFTATDAWYKAPEFFYNDNRWVVKFHSLLCFISSGELSVHRLFSAFISIIGLLFCFSFILKIFNLEGSAIKNKKLIGALYFLCSLFPAYFLHTNFVLKESIMMLYFGGLLWILYKWIIDEQFNITNGVVGLFLIITSFFFRPVFLVPLIVLTCLFLIVIKQQKFNKILFFTGSVFLILLFINLIFNYVFHKSIIEIIQYRQERFLDASKGGIFLVNTKKFVRVPYDWKNLKIDSTQKIPKVYIRKDIPLMYWYITNLNDTIIEKNKDTTEEFQILYYIERANKTVYIHPVNKQKSFVYNIKSVLESVNVFFFYPKNISGLIDIVVWIENLLLLVSLLLLVFWAITNHSIILIYFLTYFICVIIIISITSPNIGAIVRYRFFMLPLIFFIFVLQLLMTKKMKHG
jgi:hypothetical protein